MILHACLAILEPLCQQPKPPESCAAGAVGYETAWAVATAYLSAGISVPAQGWMGTAAAAANSNLTRIPEKVCDEAAAAGSWDSGE
jgi:hypothetical protein